MVDDMLLGYASAQLVVGNFSDATPAVVNRVALRVGQDIYIHAVFGVNVVILVLVLAEAVRTRAWKALVDFNYMDVSSLIISSSAYRASAVSENGNSSEMEFKKGEDMDVALEKSGAGGFSIVGSAVDTRG